jgi:hypothetical protein
LESLADVRFVPMGDISSSARKQTGNIIVKSMPSAGAQ